MDNFTIWVDAPSETFSETTFDDESNCALRTEIQNTQQYVITKLEEQESCEQERGDQAEEETTNAFKIASLVAGEAKRLAAISQDLVGIQEVCKNNELQFLAIRGDFPAAADLKKDDHEQALLETENEISKLQESLTSRRNALQKLDLGGIAESKEDAKNECKKIREVILEAKRKHEKLRTLQLSISSLQAEYSEAISRRDREKEEIKLAREVLKADQNLVEKMTEECVSLRSELVQLEAVQSNKQAETDQLEIDHLQLESEQIQRETDEITSKLMEIRKETEEAQQKLDAQKQEEIRNQMLITQRKADIIALLRTKIDEEKRKKERKPELLKIVELKKVLSGQQKELEQAKAEFDRIKIDNKSISQVKTEITKLQASVRSYERDIKKATKENEQLMEQIAKMKLPSLDGTPTKFNDTAEIDDYSQNIVTPQLGINITPIQRAVSRDVFTGAPLAVQPLMTSTPLNRNESSVNTRAAARRLDRNAAAKTAEIRKKRGGKK